MKLFVRDLTVIDASYLDEIRGFVGESYQVDVVLQGKLNQQSMILDFSSVKKQIKAIIDAEVDHKLLVPQAAKNCSVRIKQQGTQIDYLLADNSNIQLNCPNEAYCLLESEKINIELLQNYLEKVVLLQLPDNVAELKLKLRNEQISTPYYHYTHGLKKHDGNCQRIAHGHRSKIDIYINNQYSQELVQQWAERWQDIYLASSEDVVSEADLSFAVVNDGYEKLCTAYQAPQGRFELAMPVKRAEILPDDTTVEQLAGFICQQLKSQLGDNEVTVYAYEGIGKGAIAEM